MWGLKGLGWSVLVCLTSVVTCVNLWDFSRHVLMTKQLTNRANNNPVRQSSVLSSGQSLSQLLPNSLQSVSVQCQDGLMVIVVHRDLFGTGHLIQAADLSLGLGACRHTSVSASGDLVIFEMGLHECGSKLQTTSDSLIYRTTLYYNPGTVRNSIVVRNSPVEFSIECHYPRRENVSSNVLKPTWVPFSSTLFTEESLRFSLRLMTDDWRDERTSTGYWLGDELRIQADVYSENHVPLRLFVDSCIATPSPTLDDSTSHYALLDFHGCLVDGRADVASTFIIPRSQQETLQFTIEAFRFAGDTTSLIYIACHLKVAAADKEPDLLNKACFFSKPRNIWLPVEGSKDICSCCETGDCGSPGGWSREINPSEHTSSRQRKVYSGVADISERAMEADLLVGPLLILDGAWEAQRDQAATQEMAEDGIPPIIEAESPVGPHFIFQADEELRGLLDFGATVTSSEKTSHTGNHVDDAAKSSFDADESSGDMALLVTVAKMPLQGIASEVRPVLGSLQATATGILILILFDYIF